MSINIYILSAGTDYEGSAVISAFHNQGDAEDVAEKCRQLDKIRSQ